MANIDDNLMMAVGRLPGEKTPEEAINKLAKSIFEKTSMAISAATKTIIPSIPKVIEDLTQKIESGSIKNMNVAFAQLESIVKKLGIDLGSYNEKLAKTLQEREERAIKSQEKVDKLREVGVIARVNKTTKEVEILTKTQIDKEKELLKLNEKKIVQIEKEVEKGRKTLQEKDTLSPQEKSNLKKQIESQVQTLDKTKIQAQQSRETLNLQAQTGGDRLQLPPMLAGLKDAFLSPITAVGEAFSTIKDQVMGIGESFLFLGKAGIRGIATAFRFLGLIMKPIPIVIGLAIAGAIAVIYKFRDNIMSVVDFIKEIPTKVSDFLKGVFTQISDFFKSAINSVITLINKIPGVNIPLLETSAMKDNKIEQTQASKQIGTTADTSTTTEMNPEAIKRNEALKKFDEEAYIKASEEKFGSHIAPFELTDREKFKFMRTGKTMDPNELSSLSKENEQMKSKSAPVIVNNSQQSNVASSGTTITSILSNKNADDTFLNLNTAGI
jgi:hypothetical protein